MRSNGFPINDHAAREYLAAFAARSPHPKATRQIITAQPPHSHRTKQARSPHSEVTATALYAHDNVSLVSDIPLPSGNGETPKTAQTVLFESWQDALEREALQLSARRLADLEVTDLYRVGQLHALRFTRYRGSETSNRELGMKIAPQIKNVLRHPSFSDLTVREYLEYGRRIYDALPSKRGGKEWRTPWGVTVYAK